MVKFLWLKKTDPTEIHKQLSGVCGEGTVSYKVVKGWIQDFVEGREDPQDAMGGVVTNGNAAPTDPALVARTELLINQDRRITLDYASDVGGASKHAAQIIISNVLGLKRVCDRWVPRLLTPEQRTGRIATCQELYDRHEAEGDDFLTKVVVGDETLITYYQPERRPSVVTPGKAPVTTYVQFCVFYDMQGVLLLHPVPENTTMTGEYYAYILRDLLMPAIRRKRKGSNGKDREVILLQDSTALHSTKQVQGAIRELDMELLATPPDSPDILPTEYFLWPHLNAQMKNVRFKDRQSTWSAIQHHVGALTDFELGESIRRLPDRWNKVIDFSGGLHIL